jgi:hypothetical protein
MTGGQFSINWAKCMSNKKYYGYKKQTENYSITFHDDAACGRVDEGTLLTIEYLNGKFYMVKVNWGTEEDWERSRDGEVEMNWCFDEENTRKIMLRTGTHNAKEMMQAMYERFGKYKDSADHYIEKWCQEKEIEYSYHVHY